MTGEERIRMEFEAWLNKLDEYPYTDETLYAACLAGRRSQAQQDAKIARAEYAKDGYHSYYKQAGEVIASAILEDAGIGG